MAEGHNLAAIIPVSDVALLLTEEEARTLRNLFYTLPYRGSLARLLDSVVPALDSLGFTGETTDIHKTLVDYYREFH